MSFAFEAPVYWYEMPETERPHRAVLDEELCTIDGRYFFIKALIRIPVHESLDVFEWVVWISLSAASFQHVLATWEQSGREFEPPYFGWLSSQIPGYPATLNLKTNVHTRTRGERPTVELEPTDHPLALEQRTGISLTRIREIAEMMLHAEPSVVDCQTDL
jgi:hypothetical protein